MYCLEKNSNAIKLERYNYKTENELQKELYLNPNVILEIEELKLNAEEPFLVCREFPVSCGYIDLLIITKDADIVFVETKLLRNPESSRTVIAQIIDYIKTTVKFDLDTFLNSVNKLKDKRIDESLSHDDTFLLALKKNFEKGNVTGIILGDEVNSNVLELVDSIQAAPQLSFSLYLVSLNTFKMNDSLLLYPSVYSKTKEIERSVINIIVKTDNQIEIGSSVPEKNGKGSQPKLTLEEYVNTIEDAEKAKLIKDFYLQWEKFEPEDGARFGTVGFSCGIQFNGKRIPIIMPYNNYLEILNESACSKFSCNSIDAYSEYKLIFKNCPAIFDKYIISNKIKIWFNDITLDELKFILEASFEFAKIMKKANPER